MNNKQKILIVDDKAENIRFLMNILKEEYSIIAATSGPKALELARKEPKPDLILLDIMMPGMDGYDVCVTLKQGADTEGIPIIFVTALGEIADEAKGLEMGAVDYLTKPVIPELVKSRVHNQLELKRYRDHLEELVDARTLQLKKSKEATIEAMGIVAEGRDLETGGHIQRTKEYVRILAEELSKLDKYTELLTPEYIELMFHSAPLHDLGKVAIPDMILLKPGRLNDQEFEIMKRHTVTGEETIEYAQKRLEEVQMLNMAREIAGGHHEWWDGSGYPRGLKGEQIPLSARIMALADVYDAVISRRPYKEPFSHDNVIEIIVNGSGSHFDPDIVEAFLKTKKAFMECAEKYRD